MKTSVDKLVAGFLSGLSVRGNEILEGRYGLRGGNCMTLAALGKRYKVTRERIRQIQNLSLDEIRKKAAKNGMAEFTATLVSHLESLGGLRREDMLIEDMSHVLGDNGSKETLPNRVRFVLEVSGAAKLNPADRNFHAFWYLNDSHFKKAAGFIGMLAKSLESKKDVVLAENKFDEFFVQAAKTTNIKDLLATNYASISKKFMTNAYGDTGLSSWSEINPKTSRDFAYLVIKKENKPMHFTEIASKIDSIRKNKNTNSQTVHNELIKDTRFVLVGRGTYGLLEFGLMPGTAKEVMSTILKENGPLKSRDLVRLVLEKRVFKENTLLLNLQSKNHFKRLDDGRYTVKEA